MTQLDRLEALAEKGTARQFPYERHELLASIPDLIRVARAAKEYRTGNPGGIWQEGEESQKFCSVIDESPLFSEVES